MPKKKPTFVWSVYIASINGSGVGVFTDKEHLKAFSKAFKADKNKPADAFFEYYERDVEQAPEQNHFNTELNPIYKPFPEPESDIIKPAPKSSPEASQGQPEGVEKPVVKGKSTGMEGVKVRRRRE